VAFGEIEKFPSQVLAHHYPDTPNWGDMTKFKEWPDADVNVFVGGTPCQSFSVAGLRKGLDDPRGNLTLTYLAIAARYRPEWLVWENVPGVLSSNGGLDFASLLRGMGELGYGFAYRILDAQYFGVAQRRRRVFVVGYLGNWRPAAAVLFERHSLSGYPAPSREKREGAAAYAGRGIADCSPTIGCELAKQVNNQMIGNAEAFFIPSMHSELCPSLKARDAKGPSSDGDGDGDGAILVPMVQPIATHDVAGTMLSRNTSGGFSNSIDHAASGYMALQPIALQDIRAVEKKQNGRGWNDDGTAYTVDTHATQGVAQPITQFGNIAGTLTKRYDSSACADRGQNVLVQPIAYNIAPGKGALKDDIHVTDADATKTLDASGSNPAMHQGGAAIVQPIAFSGQMSYPQTDVDMTQTLQAKNPMAVMQQIGIFQDSEFGIAEYDTAGTLRAGRIPAHQMAIQAMAVRRLTPKECERLQGFPDNYTDIKPKGKATPDGPRYKALGNSMAVPVMAWIGKRIQEVDAICQTQKQ
jgi:site-specific DNA-cytosine methylase